MVVSQWKDIVPKVKGKKSHQFTTDTLGANIYFNSSGMPLYVSDDTPFTDFESHMTERWYHEYYYTKTEVSPGTAIDNFRNGTGSLYLEIINQQGYKVNTCDCWIWDPGCNWLHRDKKGFSIPELLRSKWYTLTDAIS